MFARSIAGGVFGPYNPQGWCTTNNQKVEAMVEWPSAEICEITKRISRPYGLLSEVHSKLQNYINELTKKGFF